MDGKEHFAPLLPYAMTGREQGNGRCTMKVKIQVPLEMPLPGRITGVVLNPELAYQERPGDFQGFFGWLETMIYYQPCQISGGQGEKETEKGSEAVSAGKELPGGLLLEENPLFEDEFFLDLAGEGEEVTAIEVTGRGKPVAQEEIAALVSSGVLAEGETDEISCLSYRVPFYLSHPFHQGKGAEEGYWRAQIQRMECQLSGPRTIDLEVEIALVPNKADAEGPEKAETFPEVRETLSGEAGEARREAGTRIAGEAAEAAEAAGEELLTTETAGVMEAEELAEAGRTGGEIGEATRVGEVEPGEVREGAKEAETDETAEIQQEAEEMLPVLADELEPEIARTAGEAAESSFGEEKESSGAEEAPAGWGARWGIGYTSGPARWRKREAAASGVKRPRSLGGGHLAQDSSYLQRRFGPRQSGKLCYYLVQPGDTWQKVAAVYGVSVAELLAANPALKEELIPGLCLRIPRR